MWFLLLNGEMDGRRVEGNRVGRITPGGEITEFPIPSPTGSPINIAVGPDRNIWLTKQNTLGRVTAAGAITEFDLPTQTVARQACRPEATDGLPITCWIVCG